MARREYKTIIDELQEIYAKQGHVAKHASFQGEQIHFGASPDIDGNFNKLNHYREELHKGFKKSKYENLYDKISAKQEQRNESPIGRTEAQKLYDDQKKDKYDVSSSYSSQLELKASSTIQQAAYFPTKQYLIVGFKSGSSYSYDGVGEDIIESWQAADSAGSFFYYNIRMSFKYQKLG